VPEVRGVSNLARHIHFDQRGDYWDIVNIDIPEVEAALAKLLASPPPAPENRFGFEDLLHPEIKAGAYRQYADGHYREAVINAYTGLFVELRSRTGRQEDGANLRTMCSRSNSPSSSSNGVREACSDGVACPGGQQD
jgi:hypothetical protein